jgi:hypothetical protein
MTVQLVVNYLREFFKMDNFTKKCFCKRVAIYGGRLGLEVGGFWLVLLDLDVLGLFCLGILQCLSGK